MIRRGVLPLVLVAGTTLAGCPSRSGQESRPEQPNRSDPKPQTAAEIPRAPASADSDSGAVASRGPADAAPETGLEKPAKRTPDPVGGSWVTCYANYRPTSTPERDVTRLGMLCGPSNGMRMVGTILGGDAGENAVEHVFDGRGGDCFRIFAVADPQVAELAVEVRDPKGLPLASDHNNDRWPIVNPDGPFCVMDPGKYTVRVHARQGKGKYALQVWKLP